MLSLLITCFQKLFSDIHFSINTRRDKTTFKFFFLVWFEADHWLVTRWSIRFVAQFSKQSSIYVGDIFQCIHKMYVVRVLMVIISYKQQQHKNKACTIS